MPITASRDLSRLRVLLRDDIAFVRTRCDRGCRVRCGRSAAELGQVQISDRPDLAQFQCNGALAAARLVKGNPREIAERIRDRLNVSGMFEEVAIAGPGFVNLRLKDAVLERNLRRLAGVREVATAGRASKTTVLDFGGPNIAKPMHVGHLRSAIIGDCLQRLFRANGWTVISDVHLGDWGLPMGQLISELAIRRPDLPYFDTSDLSPYPEESPVTMEELERLYPEAAAACKNDPARLEAARQATVELQAGRPGYRALWRHFHNVSAEGLQREFGSLGVRFDEWKGESDADPLIPGIIEDLKDRRLAAMDEGALIVPVGEPSDTVEVPPLILMKSDGAVNYATTDVATIVQRVREHDPELILYVVDQRQHLHFQQVFRAAKKAGLADTRRARTCRIRHRQRQGRQTVQDPRRRCDEALRSDFDGDGRGGKTPRRGGSCGGLSGRASAR